MNALKYSFMILLSVFISCSDDDDDHHHDPNWSYRLQAPQPQESSKFNVQCAKLWNSPEAEGFFTLR
jgi:hypothetical protein